MVNKTPELCNKKNKKQYSFESIRGKISGIAMIVSLILSWEAQALLPKNATSNGGFTNDGIQFCNFSRIKIGKVEWLLTAAHCIGKETEKDIAFFYGKAFQNPEISEKFQQVPLLKLSNILDKELIGKEVYIPGYIEDDTWENRYFFRLRGIVRKDENSKLFHIQISDNDIMKAKVALKRTTSIWKGISASPIILASDDSIVWIVRRATVSGENIYFSWPENIRSITTPPQK